MTYGPPPGNPPGQPSGGYGAPQGGQPAGGYGPPQQGGYGQPGQYGPPSGGQYGPPQGQYGAPYGTSQYGTPKPSFNPAAVNPLDWAVLALPVLALIFSFFSFYTAKVTANFGGQSISQSAHENAWHGFFGWFAVLLALVAAALVAMELFMPSVKLPVPTRLAALGALALSLICIIIAAFLTPGSTDNVPSSYKVDYGRGFGFWAVLVLIVAAAVVTFLRFQQTGGKLPGLGSSGASKQQSAYGQPGYGAPGQQGPAGYGAPTYGAAGQQQGYQQPPTPQGYQPQPPPGGYQPPAPQPGYPPQPSAPQPGYPPQSPAPQPGYPQQPPPAQGYPQQQPPAQHQGYQPPPPPGQTPPPAYPPPTPPSSGSHAAPDQGQGEPGQPSGEQPSQS
ncbi:MAG: hypothetical protein QOI74_1841 [Micromonosporaceae bacterium]|jgi:hypothetical protein|nr:hypothetical protein [Micromonosporaceae bacterium]